MTTMSQAFDPAREELFHLAGDPDHGISSTADLTKTTLAKPQVRYHGRLGDYVLTVDLYRGPDGLLLAHIICPKCRGALHVKQAAKQIEWNAEDGLSFEPVQCTWRPCDFRFGVSRNVARDA